MKSAYNTEILTNGKVFRRSMKDTVKIYRDAVAYVIAILPLHWEEIADLTTNGRRNFIEHLIHGTSRNVPLYMDFDEKFHKLPCYFRRDAVTRAIGKYSAYMTNLIKYKEKRYKAISNGKKFHEKEPTLNEHPNVFPTFIKGGVCERNGYLSYKLKLFMDNDWKYISVRLRKNDMDYITKAIGSGSMSNPTILFKNKKYYLTFCITNSSEPLFNRVIKSRKALCVDLGINNDAVLSVMDGEGTISGRYFVNDKDDKTLVYHLLRRKKRKQRESCTGLQPKIVTKINGLNTNIANQTANSILQIAIQESVDVIVFEHLAFKGKRGEKTHYWRKKQIIHKVCDRCHKYGIRYATVNPANTSKLAFDGSGWIARDKDNCSLCTFRTGKRYHADLNASYNIGARYFLREYEKLAGKALWGIISDAIAGLSKRTMHTYSMLREIQAYV